MAMKYYDKFTTIQLQEMYERRFNRKSYHMSREGFVFYLSLGLSIYG